MKDGTIWKFGNNVDTDQIIASQYLLMPTIEQMKRYTFESLVSDFADQIQADDVIVAGSNFGCGSSREQAPRVLKALGVGTVIAKSFARIFFRNAINIGLPLIQCPNLSDDAEGREKLSYSIEKSMVSYKGKEYSFIQFPEHIIQIIKSGGLIESINERMENEV